MKKLYYKIVNINHPQHAVLALAQIAVGIILLCNDYYFWYPPFMAGFLNDDLIGGLGIVFGLLMLKWAYSNRDRVKTNRNLLLFSVFFWSFEATAEAIHGYVSGSPHMFTVCVLEVALLILAFHVISISPKHER